MTTPGRPILVTGTHRSGTTWTGRLLEASGQTLYIHEPFNVDYATHYWMHRMPRYFHYLCDDNAGPWKSALRSLVNLRPNWPTRLKWTRSLSIVKTHLRAHRELKDARRRGLRPLIKDPIALLSAPWLARTFDMQVVVMIRHPAAFVASLVKAGWEPEFDTLLEQPLLVRDLLAAWETPMREARELSDPIVQATILWNVFHDVIDRFRQTQPGWIFVRHEDLCEDPVNGFESLYRQLGLDWNEPARRAVREQCLGEASGEGADTHDLKRNSRDAARTWLKRLTPEKIELIRRHSEPIAPRFYSDADWRPLAESGDDTGRAATANSSAA